MHMSDALLNPSVSLTMAGVSAAALGYACFKMRQDPKTHEKLPLLAMAGAFVFAAQMINFTIPGTGSSGHIGGGLLLAALLGPWPSLVTISVVLLIQCLLFADGGLLALGCNIFNMGVIPCLAVYPLFKSLMSRHLIGGTMTGALAALPLGAFAVVLQTTFSGITALPFGAFAQLMLPIHLAIALGEGLATAAVLTFVAKTHPELLDVPLDISKLSEFRLSKKAVIAILGIVAICLGVGISAFASALPDGLEWAILNTAGTENLPVSSQTMFTTAQTVQNQTSLFPDYSWDPIPGGSYIAAAIGLIVTCLAAFGLGRIFSKKTTKAI